MMLIVLSRLIFILLKENCMIKTILIAAVAALILIALIILVVLKIAKAHTQKKAASDGIITSEERAKLDKLQTTEQVVSYGLDFLPNILSRMEKVEKVYDSYAKATGQPVSELKKDEVMEKLESVCAVKGVPFDEKQLSFFVERLIEFSKIVNF